MNQSYEILTGSYKMKMSKIKQILLYLGEFINKKTTHLVLLYHIPLMRITSTGNVAIGYTTLEFDKAQKTKQK